jgi:hypothetical protein
VRTIDIFFLDRFYSTCSIFIHFFFFRCLVWSTTELTRSTRCHSVCHLYDENKADSFMHKLLTEFNKKQDRQEATIKPGKLPDWLIMSSDDWIEQTYLLIMSTITERQSKELTRIRWSIVWIRLDLTERFEHKGFLRCLLTYRYWMCRVTMLVSLLECIK